MTQKQLGNESADPTKDYTKEWYRTLLAVVLTRYSLAKLIACADSFDLIEPYADEDEREVAIQPMVRELIEETVGDHLYEIAESLKGKYCPQLWVFAWKKIKACHSIEDKWQVLLNYANLYDDNFLSLRLKTIGDLTVREGAAKTLIAKHLDEYRKNLIPAEPFKWHPVLAFFGRAVEGLTMLVLVRPALWAGRQSRKGGLSILTFFAYLWTLSKATKQGACPYFQFEDASEPEGGKKF